MPTEVSVEITLTNNLGEVSTVSKNDIQDKVTVYVSENAKDVEVGDKVVTSNISDVYLSGIQVGNISYMEHDSNHLSISGYISPSVNFEHISEVLVITKLKSDINQQ